MKIIWREWYSEQAIAAMTKMGTLPQEEMEINSLGIYACDDIARKLVEQINSQNDECFRNGGDIVILEPLACAGRYNITVTYEPYFYVRKMEDA